MRGILWIVASRPAIGICTPLERARWGAWDDEVALLPRSYLGHVHRAGGMAVLLPPDPEATEKRHARPRRGVDHGRRCRHRPRALRRPAARRDAAVVSRARRPRA